MRIFLLNILLAIAWVLLTGDLEAVNFVEGFIIGYIILFIGRTSLGNSKYFTRINKLIRFILYFLKELFLANFIVAYDIITPQDKMKPGIIALELDAKTDLEITLLANLITLTPGTLSIDTSYDKKYLYVHSMYIDDVEEFKQELKNGLERRLLEVLR